MLLSAPHRDVRRFMLHWWKSNIQNLSVTYRMIRFTFKSENHVFICAHEDTTHAIISQELISATNKHSPSRNRLTNMAVNSTGAEMASSVVQESNVHQAITFLRDPRVRSAPLIRAVEFLRAKKINDAELREAFSRLNLPFPDLAVGFLAPTQPPPRRSIFLSLLNAILSCGAIVGTLYAMRELLRRWLGPQYLALPSMDSIQRDSAELLQRQGRQLETLCATVDALRKSTLATNQKVERLSVTVSTNSQLSVRRAAETQEIRDAIRQLSQTVSAANTPISANPYSRSAKEGSLNYGRSTLQLEDSGAVDTPGPDAAFATAPNTEKKVAVPAPDDDFMKMEPAKVEKGWGGPSTVASDKVSTNTESANNTSEAVVDDGSNEREKLLATTRRLFEESIELRKNFGVDNVAGNDSTSRRSTRSAPDPEVPLSSDDEDNSLE